MARARARVRKPRTPRPPRSRDGWLIGWATVALLLVLALIAFLIIYRPHL